MPRAGGLKLRALTRRAEQIGVDEALLEDAGDSAELIELIVAKEQAIAAEASAKLEVWALSHLPRCAYGNDHRASQSGVRDSLHEHKMLIYD
eukprot:COSAG02_NODE_2369_length_9049_cov_37.484358_7_plen_92_part_00